MSIMVGIAGGATGAITYRLIEELLGSKAPPRPVRRYRGYPTDTDTVYYDGPDHIAIGPPVGWGWEILGAMWYVATGAGSAGVTPTIHVRRRSDNALILPVLLPPRAASEFDFIYFMQAASYPEFAFAPAYGVVFPLPLNGELKDETLDIFLDGGTAGNEQHRLFIYYEEFEL